MHSASPQALKIGPYATTVDIISHRLMQKY